MNREGRSAFLIFLLAIAVILAPASCEHAGERIGVLFVIHGGMDTNKSQYMWDATVQQFSYDHNHSVYKFVIWNSTNWSMMLDTKTTDFAARFLRMYEFEYERIGGTDPYYSISEQQLTDMKAELDKNPYGITFEVDWAGYMAADRLDHYAYPRFIYYGPDGPGQGDNCTYCGEDEDDGPWPDCDPGRHNVDGPVERLLEKGVSRIIVVDLIVAGPRFSKTYDVVQMSKRALDAWNAEHGTSVTLTWVNDYTNLMERSYPTAHEGWTRSLGPPETDPKVSLEESPNPIVEDIELATLHVEGIEARFSDTVSHADTGVILFNHALHDHNECFDPKIDDTLIINENIKSLLLERHPDMDSDNIVGAYGGILEVNSENGLEERNREMRGESYGYAWLYESDKELPGDEWGYRYWEALEYLKNRSVTHIVIAFPQIITDSVLNLVELPNQIGKEIGIKTWARWGTGDYTTYPAVGHPFAEYWGIWVDTDCGEWELAYDSGATEFTAGTTLTGHTSGATGVIKWFTLDSGNWAGGDAAGTLSLKQISGAFLDREIITDDKTPAGSATANADSTMVIASECCFEMGGCGDASRTYPPPRQTPLNQKRSDLDPSLCFDMSDYGQLGYDSRLGPPDYDNPVQNQYAGTWDLWVAPNSDSRVGKLLAAFVLEVALENLQ
jgi:hypothetical protein